MNSSQPVLERHALSRPSGVSSTSSCSTFTLDGPDAFGKSNTSGSENGSVVSSRALLPDHGGLGTPRSSSRWRRRARTRSPRRRCSRVAERLVDLGTGGRPRSGRSVREARLSRADEREQPGAHALGANCASPASRRSPRTGAPVWLGQVIAMSRYVQASSAAAKIGGLKRGSTALRIASSSRGERDDGGVSEGHWRRRSARASTTPRREFVVRKPCGRRTSAARDRPTTRLPRRRGSYSLRVVGALRRRPRSRRGTALFPDRRSRE